MISLKKVSGYCYIYICVYSRGVCIFIMYVMYSSFDLLKGIKTPPFGFPCSIFSFSPGQLESIYATCPTVIVAI